jgi:glycosidase
MMVLRRRGAIAAAATIWCAVACGIFATGCAGAGTGASRVRDWRSDVFAMIVTDRFDDGDTSNNHLNGRFAPGDPDGVHGGDFAGIERRLPYLRDLGITAIWITPVQKNVDGAYHGYWIQDLFSVDPRLGTMDDLRRLIRRAHEHGIAVFLDIVCNHTGPMSAPIGGQHAWSDTPYTLAWRDSSVLPSPAFFRNLDIYHRHGDVKEWRDPYQILGELPGGLDDLATERADVREMLIEIYTWWMEQTGCDGFRVDTVKHVEADFWYEFLAAMRLHAEAIGRRDFFIFGEVFAFDDESCARYTWTDSLGRRGFDAVLNFSLSGSIRNAFAEDRGVADLARSIRNLSLYDSAARGRLFTFVDNHDIPRFLHLAGGDTKRIERALTLLFALEGIPILYYGTEQGFRGGAGDGENRAPMFVRASADGAVTSDYFDATSQLYQHIARLATVRRTHPILQLGATEIVRVDEAARLLVLQRTHEGKSAFVVINLSDTTREVQLPSLRRLRHWLDGATTMPCGVHHCIDTAPHAVDVWLEE